MHEREMEALALDALDLVRNGLLVNLRFMSAAFARLAPLPTPGATFATDGAHLRFDPATWARTYARDSAEATRSYLHVVLHNVFLHLYPGANVEPDLWDIACDMVLDLARKLCIFSGTACPVVRPNLHHGLCVEH